jgi:hypothetical protein
MKEPMTEEDLIGISPTASLYDHPIRFVMMVVASVGYGWDSIDFY